MRHTRDFAEEFESLSQIAAVERRFIMVGDVGTGNLNAAPTSPTMMDLPSAAAMDQHL